jgi:hypothetical protein
MSKIPAGDRRRPIGPPGSVSEATGPPWTRSTHGKRSNCIWMNVSEYPDPLGEATQRFI